MLFLGESVEYLGHVITNKGIHPTKAKVLAVQNAPVPQDITQSFLGLINYYRNSFQTIRHANTFK